MKVWSSTRSKGTTPPVRKSSSLSLFAVPRTSGSRKSLLRISSLTNRSTSTTRKLSSTKGLIWCSEATARASQPFCGRLDSFCRIDIFTCQSSRRGRCSTTLQSPPLFFSPARICLPLSKRTFTLFGPKSLSTTAQGDFPSALTKLCSKRATTARLTKKITG